MKQELLWAEKLRSLDALQNPSGGYQTRKRMARGASWHNTSGLIWVH